MKHTRLRLLVASAFTLLVAACNQVPTPQAQADTQLTPQFGTKGDDRTGYVAIDKNIGAIFVAGDTYGSLHGKKKVAGRDSYLERRTRVGSSARHRR